MTNYKMMYSILFNAITDAIVQSQKCQPLEAVAILKTAQRQTEEMYMEDK